MGQLRALRYPRQVDLAIGLGESFKRRRPQPGTTAVHISHDPHILGRPFPVDLAVASDVRMAIRDISDAMDGLLTRDRMNRIRSSRLAEVSAYTAQLKDARGLTGVRSRGNASASNWNVPSIRMR
jgi:thiamine pyrophosphate-dependent acetolactate synthase large subunit-like protein